MNHALSESDAGNTFTGSDASLSHRKRCTKGEVAERLVAARKALGLTQKAMAATIEMALPSLKDYEKGKSIPGGEALEGFIWAGINVYWLLTGDGPMLIADMGKEPEPSVDTEVLEGVVEGVETALKSRHIAMPPSKKARLISALYDYCKASGQVGAGAVDRFLELAT